MEKGVAHIFVFPDVFIICIINSDIEENDLACSHQKGHDFF